VLITSREGEGTVISLCLPPTLKVVAATPDVAEAASGRGEGGRALLVEDDDGVAAMVTEMLGELGFEVARSPDAGDALAKLEADQAFDLVLSDMVMPGDLDGRMLAREIRSRLPRMPVLLTSGYSAAAAEAEADGFRVLAKPYRLDALDEALREARDDVQTAKPPA
jgi:CheY-like chemotaxis protein